MEARDDFGERRRKLDDETSSVARRSLIVNERSLGLICGGQEHATNTTIARTKQMSDRTAKALHSTIERQLSKKKDAFDGRSRDDSKRSERAERDGEIKCASTLLHVGRGEVDRDAVFADVDSDTRERALDAHPTLADRRFREPHELERWNASLRLHFDAHGMRGDSVEHCTLGDCEHARD